MNSLPVELHYHLAKFLDGFELRQARFLSRHWDEVVGEIHRKRRIRAVIRNDDGAQAFLSAFKRSWVSPPPLISHLELRLSELSTESLEGIITNYNPHIQELRLYPMTCSGAPELPGVLPGFAFGWNKVEDHMIPRLEKYHQHVGTVLAGCAESVEILKLDLFHDPRLQPYYHPDNIVFRKLTKLTLRLWLNDEGGWEAGADAGAAILRIFVQAAQTLQDVQISYEPDMRFGFGPIPRAASPGVEWVRRYKTFGRVLIMPELAPRRPPVRLSFTNKITNRVFEQLYRSGCGIRWNKLSFHASPQDPPNPMWDSLAETLTKLSITLDWNSYFNIPPLPHLRKLCVNIFQCPIPEQHIPIRRLRQQDFPILGCLEIAANLCCTFHLLETPFPQVQKLQLPTYGLAIPNKVPPSPVWQFPAQFWNILKFTTYDYDTRQVEVSIHYWFQGILWTGFQRLTKLVVNECRLTTLYVILLKSEDGSLQRLKKLKIEMEKNCIVVGMDVVNRLKVCHQALLLRFESSYAEESYLETYMRKFMDKMLTLYTEASR